MYVGLVDEVVMYQERSRRRLIGSEIENCTAGELNERVRLNEVICEREGDLSRLMAIGLKSH